MFGITHTDHLKRELREARDQVAALTSANEALTRQLAEHEARAETPKAQPANLTEVTHFLRAFLPTLPLAPAYNSLTAATDAKSYAQAINLLFQHARMVGHQEANR